MKKIAIIGCCGSGKTTFALQLHKLLKLPLYHLDNYYWKPHWQRAEFKEFEEIHNQLCTKDQWIIEGIYTQTLEHRISTADTVFFLDMPRYLYLWRVFKRTFLYYGKQSPGAPAGCYERFDLQFLKYVWTFKTEKRPIILNLLNSCSADKKIYTFRSVQDINGFINC